MTDGDIIKTLDTTTEEKDLGIGLLVTMDLKSQEQCIQSVKKPQTLSGMAKTLHGIRQRRFRDYLQRVHQATRGVAYCVYAWSPLQSPLSTPGEG